VVHWLTAAPPGLYGEPMPVTFAVDCGGGGLKAAVVDDGGALVSDPVRVPTPYPLPPQRLGAVLQELAAASPPFARATVGVPGMVRHGVVLWTPHYVTAEGPATDVVDELVNAWSGFDLATAVREWLGVPVIVLNDAELHAAGVVQGDGLELVLTLGTGVGCGWTDHGRLAPHLELSAARIAEGRTADDHVGELARQRVGDDAWALRVAQLLEWAFPVFGWDHLYLGGGNAARLTRAQLPDHGRGLDLIPNQAALAGGSRAWELGFGS
jgi:polyphosphate glucokinase